MSDSILPEHYGQHDECADCADAARYQAMKEIKHTLRVSRSSCTSCGTDLEKHDYAFFRIGRLRAEIEVAIRLLKQNVTPSSVIRELDRALFDTRFDYRPPGDLK
jgi:hypothetical protein